MSESTQTKVVSRIDVLNVFGVVFVTLKLCGEINWSWWWVLCPFWIKPAAVFLFLTVIDLRLMIQNRKQKEKSQ